MQSTPGRGLGPGLAPVSRQMLLVCSFLLAAAWGQMNFTGDQVLRVLAKNEKQLSLLRDLEGLKPQKVRSPQNCARSAPYLTEACIFGCPQAPNLPKSFQPCGKIKRGSSSEEVDFWRGPARPSLPVDMRVSFSELKDVKDYLDSHGLAYSIMIKDIQLPHLSSQPSYTRALVSTAVAPLTSASRHFSGTGGCSPTLRFSSVCTPGQMLLNTVYLQNLQNRLDPNHVVLQLTSKCGNSLLEKIGESTKKKAKITHALTIEGKIQFRVLLDQEREAMARSRRLERSASSFSYSSYHTLEEIYSWIDNFVTEHSDIVSKIRIGHSFENRSILVLKFSTGGVLRPAVWIDTGIHSREWITHATGIWTAKKIVSEYGKDRLLTKILNSMDIFMEIVTNPDGFAFTHSMNRLWRKNKSNRSGIFCIGVDLNRNWKSGFGGNGSNNNPCSETYHGPAPESEPEVAAMVKFITTHGNIKALLSIHSYSQMLMYPYGHSLEPVSDQEELFNLAKNAAQALHEVHGIEYVYGSISTTLYVASGITVDWAYDHGIKYSFSFELRDTGQYGFLLPASQIVPTAQETWLALLTIMEYTLKHPY